MHVSISVNERKHKCNESATTESQTYTVLFIKSGRMGQTTLRYQMLFEYLVEFWKREVMSYTTSDICYDIT